MSFIWLWRCCLGALLRQDSPCSPRASTGFPHTQVCGSQALLLLLLLLPSPRNFSLCLFVCLLV